MSNRIVNIKLLADATGMVQGLARAKDAAGELNAKVKESAKSQRQEWATVGTGLTAVGVAITGVGVAALATGIQYNTLQQTSRAAMTSLLGSAQAANAQMDKLDDFARNSPFSKATFITAQQQMLAFGIEAKKVIPYLDGVQNAVAAAGGSNADIEGIVATMSKIQSSSKITATDLMEFGNRGVNAADLIGSQMGKTGAQIRTDITAGTLGAEQALDALTAGMSQKFSGAADNVKNTFAGSMDRVKAAWRDFSAELAKPLVDPNGGGALVDLLNWTADAMRNFEALPGPVKGAASAIVGLAGAGTLALGSAMLILPKWYEFTDALKVFTANAGTARVAASGFAKFLTGPWGVALMAAASVVAVLVSENAKLSNQARELSETLDESTGAITANSKAWAANQLQSEGVLSAAKRMGISAKDMTDAWLGNEAALGRVNSRLNKFRKDADFRMENADWKGWSDDLVSLDYALDGSNKVLAEAKTRHNELAEATNEAGEATSNSSEQIGAMGDVAAATQEAITALVEEIANFGSAQIDADRSTIAFEEQLEKLNERLAEGATGLDLTTEAGRANQSSLLDVASAANKAAADVLNVTGSQEAANEVLNRARDRLIEAGVQYGKTSGEAAAYADKVLATPETITTTFNANTAAAEAAIAQYKALMSDVGGVINTTLNVMTNLTGEKHASGGTVGYAVGGTIGFARGGTIPGLNGGVRNGTVYGPGTSKSDSVPALLSRGEEVIQEPYASLHRPMLKAINRGDFVNSSPMMLQQAPAKIVEVPTHVTVVDAGNQFVTTMKVVANREIDQYVDQQASEHRRSRG
ncbi:tape measure protein [Leucobacter salsicius]|uniref:tape measure protein n=1 Tax=Leucobacter salsicius TaxID=664638 RepID=UPI00034948F8|nr:tape measure protein [Leucobacter salsicius]